MSNTITTTTPYTFFSAPIEEQELYRKPPKVLPDIITKNINKIEIEVENELDFILAHVGQPAWPRKIATENTKGGQRLVYSKIEAMMLFKESGFLNCRINAFRPVILNDTVQTILADFLMLDIDRNRFKSKREMDVAKDEIIDWLYKVFRINKSKNPIVIPFTIVWSGRGYHIYIPLDPEGKIIDQMQRFRKYTKNPGKDFLRFAENHLAKGNCDVEHNKTVSYNNCLLRIPGSYNYREKNGVAEFIGKVKVIQRWDGVTKVQARLLYDEFLDSLKRDNIAKQKNQLEYNNYLTIDCVSTPKNVLDQFLLAKQKAGNGGHGDSSSGPVKWIETLLTHVVLPDYRKYCIWRIIAPYFINTLHIPAEEVHSRICVWLERCNKLHTLDFQADVRAAAWIDSAEDKGYYPISFDNPEKEPATLKTEKNDLYEVIKTKMQSQREREGGAPAKT